MFNKLNQFARRIFSGTFAIAYTLAFTMTMVAQLLLPNVAHAVGVQLTSRKITMSTSAINTSSVTYALQFTPGAVTEQELIIDFCSNSPLIGDTCSFSAATVPTIAGSLTSSLGTATGVAGGAPTHVIKVTGLTITASTQFTISFTVGITNPNTTVFPGSFYARVLTYATGNASGYTPTSTSGNADNTLGTYVDYGGIAISTANNIAITSKVFETLTFCIYTGASCAAGAAPSITLGGATTGALDASNAYVNSDTKYDVATNAGSGLVVSMTGTTLCRPGGTCATGASAFTISAIGSTATALSVGSEQFGMCAYKNGSAALTVAAQYADTVSTNVCNPAGLTDGIYAGTSRFGLDDSNTVTTGTASAGGSQVLTASGAVPTVTGRLTFLGDIAAATEAGIYTTNLNLVATGTF